jgi:hypothetical protein
MAQTEVKTKKHRNGSFYFSWGYNEEWYTNSNVHITQNALGNNYEMVEMKAQDHKGWDNGILNKALTIPQYNYRLGWYFNERQDLGFEFNFDHTKYLLTDGQMMQVVGTMGNEPINKFMPFSQANGFYYYLNNGANFFLFNFVRRTGLYSTRNNNLHIDLVCKAGIGPVIPHVQNMLFGQANTPHFQLGGWNAGQENVIRATIMKYGFIEFSEKVDYAQYSHLAIYDGLAKQNFGTIEFIASIGFILPSHNDNPKFARMADQGASVMR